MDDINTANDISYEIECLNPRCGYVVWSFWRLETCPHCNGASLKIIEEPSQKTASWDNVNTEHWL